MSGRTGRSAEGAEKGEPTAFGRMLARFAEDKAEYRKVFVLLAYLLCLSAASTVGRTTADALFLSRFDSSLLSRMYLPQSAALLLAGYLFQRYGSRVRIDILIRWALPATAVLAILSRIGLELPGVWIYPVIYVAYDVLNFLMIVCFWQFAASVLDQRKAKRTIGLVGSGGLIGGIVSGFGLKLIVPWIGTENLIFVYAALPLLALLAVVTLVRLSGNPADVFDSSGKTEQKASTAKTKRKPESGKAGLFASVPHLKYLAILSASLILTLTFIDYQFKVIVSRELQNEALAGFMGSFYGFAGLLALAMQVFVAGKLLTRFGVMTAILVFPIVLLTGSVGILLFPVLAMAVAVKGSDKVVGDTINSSVNQLVMFPIPGQWRNQAKSFLDGIVRNGAKGLAAIGLLALSPFLTVQQFSYVTVALLGVCLFAAIKVKAAYLRTLMATLQADEARFDETELDLVDPASRELLANALRSPDKQQVLYAFRTVASLDGFDVIPHLPRLLRHPSRDVVFEALRYVERTKPPGVKSDIVTLLDEVTDGSVKSQTLLVLSAYSSDEHLERIAGYLDGTEGLEAKAGAIAGLIKYYGIEGMFRAVGELKALIGSGDELERSAVAALFGQIGLKEFYKPLVPLLYDESPRVRRLALRSVAVLQVQELVPHVVPLLRGGATRKAAIEALAAYDEKLLIPLLEPYFADADASTHLPKVFERIATPLVFETLLAHYETSSLDMKDKLLEALTRIRRNVEPTAPQLALMEQHALREIAYYWAFSENIAGLSGATAYREVADVAGGMRKAIVKRVFQWLALLYEASAIQAIYANWAEGDARRQANAMEALDQLAQGQIRLEVAKIMGASEAAGAGDRSEAALKRQLAWLGEQDDAWLRETIAYALNPEADEELRDRMERIRLLRSFAMFQGLASRELSALSTKLAEEVVAKGEFVFEAGDRGNSLYLIREGRVGIYRGGERIGGRGPGESFGQSGILISRDRSADVRADEDSTFWRLDSDAFYEVMFDRPPIAMEMMKLLSRRTRAVLAEQAKAGAAKTSAAPAVSAATVTAGPSTGSPDIGSEGQDAAGVSARSEPQRAQSPLVVGPDEVVPSPKSGEAALDMSTSAEALSATREAAASTELSGGNPHNSLLRRVLILQKIDLFAHLSEEDLLRLAQMVDEVEYETDEPVCRVGDYGDTLFGIIEGAVLVHRGYDPIARLGEGDCFGEMAIIDSGPRSADCTATEPTVLLQLHRDQVFSLCFQNIDVMRSMIHVMGERLKGLLG